MFERASLIRNIGRATGQTTYGHQLVASNWRLGGLQGALLVSQFKKFPEYAKRRDENIRSFTEALKGIEGITGEVEDKRQTKRGCYFYICDFDAAKFGCSRDKFIEAVRAEGFESVMAGYGRPIYKEAAFAPDRLRPFVHHSVALPDYNALCLPNSEKWADRQVVFLHYYFNLDKAATLKIVEAIKKIKANVSELA